MKKIDPKILQNLEQENQAVKQHVSQVVLALDYGEKFCGLAWTPDGIMVFPLGVFATEQITGEMQKIIQNKKVEKLILGLPISSDGGENEVCKKIRSFSKKFEGLLPFEFINERFSSQKVITSDKERIDDLAAAQILEFYLSQVK